MSRAELIGGMRALKGQFCTPLGMGPMATELVTRGFMRFCEWPSGHWSITDKGKNFLMDEEAES